MQSRNFAALTWLRALAAATVVISHAIRAVEPTAGILQWGWMAIPAKFFDLGHFGVYLFFALSGCTLYISNNALPDAAAVGRFFSKRFMRIWPAFITSLIVFELFDMLLLALDVNHAGWLAQCLKPGGVNEFFRYALLISNFTGPGEYFNSVYWSIPVEFQFYLMFPLVLLSMRGRSLAVLSPLLAGAVLYVLGRKELIPMDRYEVLTMAYVFFGGMLIGHLRSLSTRMIEPATGAALLGGVLVLVSGKSSGLIGGVDLGAKLYGVAALLCVTIAMATKLRKDSGRIGQLASHYGEVSYSIYLFHMLFVGVASLLASALALQDNVLLYSVILASLLGSYALSILTYRWIEYPSILLGRRLLSNPATIDKSADASR